MLTTILTSYNAKPAPPLFYQQALDQLSLGDLKTPELKGHAIPMHPLDRLRPATSGKMERKLE